MDFHRQFTVSRFNTRARARRALPYSSHITPEIVLQHTCPREAGTGYCRGIIIGVPASTHVPARGGHKAHPTTLGVKTCFNTRARARRAHLSLSLPNGNGCFNTRARARRAPRNKWVTAYCRGFNTRARARRAHSSSRPRAPAACFNTRARARRAPTWVKVRHVGIRASTHVPARGGH